MANIGLSMAVLPFIVAFWLMFRGFASTGYAMDLKRYGTRNWGWYMAFGVLAILCSIGIIWQPGLGALSLVYMIAYTLLIIGIFRVMLSFELKSLHKRNKEYYEEQGIKYVIIHPHNGGRSTIRKVTRCSEEAPTKPKPPDTF